MRWKTVLPVNSQTGDLENSTAHLYWPPGTPVELMDCLLPAESEFVRRAQAGDQDEEKPPELPGAFGYVIPTAAFA